MRVLLVGGSGYVGSVLAAELLRRGCEVTILDRLIFGLHIDTQQRGLVVYQADIRDVDATRSIIRGHDAVVHLAFASNDPAYQLDTRLARAINISPLAPLLAAAIEARVARFIFLSSCSVYGESDSISLDEQSKTHPLTDYARHKLDCETILSRNTEGRSLCWTILRPATLCGHSPRLRLDLLLNRMLAEAVCRGIIHIEKANRRRPVLPLSELVSVISETLHARPERVCGRTFNVAFDCRTVGQWSDLVARLTGATVLVKPIEHHVRDSRSYGVSSDLLRQTLSYVPRYSVEQSLADLTVALRSGEFQNPLTDARWSNLATQARHDFMRAVPMQRMI